MKKPCIGVFALMLCAASVSAGDWPTWRYDAQHSANTPDALPEDLQLRWTLRLRPPSSAWPDTQYKLNFDDSYEPIVVGKHLIVPSMTADHITAWHTDTLEPVWRFHTDGPVRFAPTAYEGRVYVASDDGYLYCLSADDGRLIWKRRGGPDDRKVIGNHRLISAWPVRGAPVVHDGVLYWAAGIWPFMGTFIYATDPATGETIWCNSGSGATWTVQQHHSPAFAGVAPQGYTTAIGDTLLVSGGRTVPAAYDRKTGDLMYYHVEQRHFDKSAGGYEVCAGHSWFFNRDCTYFLEGGAPVDRLDPRVLTDEAILGVKDNKLTAWDWKRVKETYTDRKGKERTREHLNILWQADIDAKLQRLFIKAGSRVYARTMGGDLLAIELPAGDRPARMAWRYTLDGAYWNMLAADDKLFVVMVDGTVHCFGSPTSDHPIVRTDEPGRDLEIEDGVAAQAARLLDAADAPPGYALVLGTTDGALPEAIAHRREDLHVTVLQPEDNDIDALRARLDRSGTYGSRVAVIPGTITGVTLPPYFASMIVVEDARRAGLSDAQAFSQAVFRCLRPYGGTACLRLTDDQHAAMAKAAVGLSNAKLIRENGWTLLRRDGALPGAADWTHQYADAANSVVSKDRNPKAPLGLLWFGGPSNAKILPRHGHGPSPQVAGGRLFIEGPDILRAVDVYTGTVFWEKQLPGVGRYYDYTSHEPGANAIGSNYVSLTDSVYIVYNKQILRLDSATGRTLGTFELPEEHGEHPNIGYVGVDGDHLVATARPLSFWNPDFEPDGFKRAKPEQRAAWKAAIESLADFEPITDVEDDVDYLVRNFNQLLGTEDLLGHIPDDVRRKKSDNAEWMKQATDIVIRMQRIDDPNDRRRMRRELLEHYYDLPRKPRPRPGQSNPAHTASARLVALDRFSGDVQWMFTAKHALRHNAIVLADGKVFCLDRLPESEIKVLQRRGIEPPTDSVLWALDIDTGDDIWHTDKDVFGTWLGYSAEHDILIQAGSRSRDRAHDEVGRGMIAYQADTGEPIWRIDDEYGGPVMLHHDTIITQGTAYHLLTGERKKRLHPLTGREIDWNFMRHYGCNTAIASEHLLTFRSAAAGFYDLAGDGGTGNLGGFKTGCTSNLIAADGVLNAPDYTRTCTCSYQNQTSIAFVHDPSVEMWTFTAVQPDNDAPIRRVGINFGAPGDRQADSGTLWLDCPSTGGDSPDPPSHVAPDHVRYYRHHASLIETPDLPWVAASGVEGLQSFRITLAPETAEPRKYTVRLIFAECEGAGPGERVFDVAVQGEAVAEHLDVVRKAGGPWRAHVVQVPNVEAATDLTVGLKAAPDTRRPPIISGIEIVAEQ